MRWERTLLGGCPFLVFLARGFPQFLANVLFNMCARCRLGGSPPSSTLRLRAEVARSLLELALPPSYPRAGCARCWEGGPLSSSDPWPCARYARCRVWGSPPGPCLRCLGLRCWVGGTSLRSPSRLLHALSARDRSGGFRPPSLAPCTPRAGSAHYRVLSPYFVALRAWPADPLVASWTLLLPRSPALDGSTTILVGASKPYLRHASAPCSGLAPLVPEVCLFGVPALPLSSAVPRCGRGGGANKQMAGTRTATPPRPHWGTAEDNGSAGTLNRHTSGTNGARPEHGALA